jgi:hypothetical protein
MVYFPFSTVDVGFDDSGSDGVDPDGVGTKFDVQGACTVTVVFFTKLGLVVRAKTPSPCLLT